MNTYITQFENAIAEYTNSPYAVGLDSCTSCVFHSLKFFNVKDIVLPRRTFVSIYTHALLAKCKVAFNDIEWNGTYRIEPTTIYDCAKRLKPNMYAPGAVMCLSFGRDKPVSIANHTSKYRGGMVLTDNETLVKYLREISDEHLPRSLNNERSFFYHDCNCSMLEEEAKIGLELFNAAPPTEDAEEASAIHYPDLSQYKMIKVKDRVKILSYPKDDDDHEWILDNAKYINKKRYVV